MVYNGYILLIQVYRHCNHKLLVSARCGRSAAIKMGDMPVEVMMWNYDTVADLPHAVSLRGKNEWSKKISKSENRVPLTSAV